MNPAEVRKRLAVDASRDTRRGTGLDDQGCALLFRQAYELVDTAVRNAVGPVEQLDLCIAGDALEDELAVGGGRLSLKLKDIGHIVDLARLEHLPVEGKSISLRGPVRGDDQPQLGAAHR